VLLCTADPHRSWFDYLEPILVLISLVIAVVGVLSARALARQKATLDLIEKAESSDVYKDLNAVFSATRKSGGWAALPSAFDATAS
jgi:hypothetical protein